MKDLFQRYKIAGPAQQSLFRVLYAHEGDWIALETLVEGVYGRRADGGPLTGIKQAMSKLRRKITPDWRIECRRGEHVAYRLMRADARSASLDDIAGRVRQAMVRVLSRTPGEFVPTEHLIDAVFPETPPADPGNSIRVQAYALRRILADQGWTIEGRPHSGFRMVEL